MPVYMPLRLVILCLYKYDERSKVNYQNTTQQIEGEKTNEKTKQA